MNYYIYYRVGNESTATLEALIQQLQATLFVECGISGKLLKKHDELDTWMEVYENVTDRIVFESTLDKLLADLKITAYLPPGQTRKTECFYVM